MHENTHCDVPIYCECSGVTSPNVWIVYESRGTMCKGAIEPCGRVCVYVCVCVGGVLLGFICTFLQHHWKSQVLAKIAIYKNNQDSINLKIKCKNKSFFFSVFLSPPTRPISSFTDWCECDHAGVKSIAP